MRSDALPSSTICHRMEFPALTNPTITTPWLLMTSRVGLLEPSCGLLWAMNCGCPPKGCLLAIQRRFGRADRFRLLGRTGFVSDDTEHYNLHT